MRRSTLLFLTKKDPGERVLLGMKKRGFGAGKFNGFGGKVEDKESVHAAAVREVQEEVGVFVEARDLMPRGVLEFIYPANSKFDQEVHLFVVTNWQGEIGESEEMAPTWFDVSEIPFALMWQDDKYWLPRVLAGESVVARVVFEDDNETVAKYVEYERSR